MPFLPTMSHPKPVLFVKITPVNPDGVTVVDLGTEMGQELPVARHSSLPPSPTRAEYNHDARAARHGSLPPLPNQPIIQVASPVVDSIEEMVDESDDTESESVGVAEPPSQNSTTLRVQVNPAEVS
jgi:hypothetical protein